MPLQAASSIWHYESSFESILFDEERNIKNELSHEAGKQKSSSNHFIEVAVNTLKEDTISIDSSIGTILD